MKWEGRRWLTTTKLRRLFRTAQTEKLACHRGLNCCRLPLPARSAKLSRYQIVVTCVSFAVGWVLCRSHHSALCLIGVGNP
ncbi:hypothetical protein KCP74_20330 [Salmonella enterica subsp. enterica]|nr:hypothetical protein KCP74_20330 [Salmonella enterica subsp. enterica]